MLNISATSSMQTQLSLASAPDRAPGTSLETRQAFQDFVAGTFFKQMLKSLRSGQGEIQYLGGGQAEKLFRGQLDQQLAEDLARDHGAPFAAPLYQNFENYRQARQAELGGQLNHFA